MNGRRMIGEDRPPLARIKKLALTAYRKAAALRAKPVPAYAGIADARQQLFDLRRAHEAAEELSANLAARIRAIEYEAR